MSARERLAARVPQRLRARAGRAAAKVAETSGLEEVAALEARLVPLEEAVAENAALAVPLEAHLARVERDLLPLLEAVAGERDEGADRG